MIVHAKELIDRLGCGAAIVATMDAGTATRADRTLWERDLEARLA